MKEMLTDGPDAVVAKGGEVGQIARQSHHKHMHSTAQQRALRTSIMLTLVSTPRVVSVLLAESIIKEQQDAQEAAEKEKKKQPVQLVNDFEPTAAGAARARSSKSAGHRGSAAKPQVGSAAEPSKKSDSRQSKPAVTTRAPAEAASSSQHATRAGLGLQAAPALSTEAWGDRATLLTADRRELRKRLSGGVPPAARGSPPPSQFHLMDVVYVLRGADGSKLLGFIIRDDFRPAADMGVPDAKRWTVRVLDPLHYTDSGQQALHCSDEDLETMDTELHNLIQSRALQALSQQEISIFNQPFTAVERDVQRVRAAASSDESPTEPSEQAQSRAAVSAVASPAVVSAPVSGRAPSSRPSV